MTSATKNIEITLQVCGNLESEADNLQRTLAGCRTFAMRTDIDPTLQYFLNEIELYAMQMQESAQMIVECCD